MAQAYTPSCNTFAVVWDLFLLLLCEAVGILGGDVNKIACALFNNMLRKLRRLSDAHSGSAFKLATTGDHVQAPIRRPEAPCTSRHRRDNPTLCQHSVSCCLRLCLALQLRYLVGFLT